MYWTQLKLLKIYNSLIEQLNSTQTQQNIMNTTNSPLEARPKGNGTARAHNQAIFTRRLLTLNVSLFCVALIMMMMVMMTVTDDGDG